MLRRTGFLSTAFALACSSGAWASEEADHPMIAAYPKADLSRTLRQEYEPFSFPSSIVNTNTKPASYTHIDTKADLWQNTYEIKDVSTLKVYENYMQAAKKLGFNIVFSCQLESCGSEQQASELGELISARHSVYNYYRKPYYFLAEKQTPKGKTYAAWFIGAYESDVAVQQAISDAATLDANLIKVDAAALAKGGAPAPVEKASAEELARDHKLFARYPGANLGRAIHTDSETFALPVAPTAADKTPLSLNGDLWRHSYTIKDVSTLKIYENYKQALSKAGFTVLSKCELDECGNEKYVTDLGEKISPNHSVYNYYRKPYYIVAKKVSDGSDIYAAFFIGAYESEVGVQQVILQTKGMVNNLIKVDADSLKSQIDADGKALIYGIYFDTGKAAVKPESKPTLDAIAQLLNKNKDLMLYVVGHTDDTGAGAANLDLSRQRAAAVVAELVNVYKIPAARLQAQGVGPYAPASNNTSEAGKQKNRRVELVKRLQ
jgi:outer membrane protein OmpA-like peptidoglycan-associated protein